MLYSQLFLFYFAIFHLQHVHCKPKIFAHLLKCNLQWEISAGRTAPANWECSEIPQVQSGVSVGGWQSGSFSGGSYDGYLEIGEKNQSWNDELWILSTSGVPTQTDALPELTLVCRPQGRLEPVTAPKGNVSSWFTLLSGGHYSF